MSHFLLLDVSFKFRFLCIVLVYVTEEASLEESRMETTWYAGVE